MRVYIAGLYSRNAQGEKADVMEVLTNINDGLAMASILLLQGYNVFCPHLDHQYMFQGWIIPEQRFKDNSMAWLEVSDCVLVISGQGLGGGVDAEIARAEELGIPVYCSLEEFNG